MPRIKFIDFNEMTHEFAVPSGSNVMRIATENGVPGIDGDCGGICACATCHVYVDEAWMETVGTRTDEEQSMLTFSPILQPNSRLACRIAMSARLDGLVLRLPEGQH